MTAVAVRRWWALGALAVGLLVVGLDLTIPNVALPTVLNAGYRGRLHLTGLPAEAAEAVRRSPSAGVEWRTGSAAGRCWTASGPRSCTAWT
jgi:hypothetical protein